MLTLKGVVRARSQLLRADDFDGFVALAQLEHGVRPYVELKGLSVDEEARLRIQLQGRPRRLLGVTASAE